jgi:hypothetical protein
MGSGIIDALSSMDRKTMIGFVVAFFIAHMVATKLGARARLVSPRRAHSPRPHISFPNFHSFATLTFREFQIHAGLFRRPAVAQGAPREGFESRGG